MLFNLFFHHEYAYCIFRKPLTFPIAKRPLSNRNNIPRNKKNIPNPESPIPISFSDINQF